MGFEPKASFSPSATGWLSYPPERYHPRPLDIYYYSTHCMLCQVKSLLTPESAVCVRLFSATTPAQSQVVSLRLTDLVSLADNNIIAYLGLSVNTVYYFLTRFGKNKKPERFARFTEKSSGCRDVAKFRSWRASRTGQNENAGLRFQSCIFSYQSNKWHSRRNYRRSDRVCRSDYLGTNTMESPPFLGKGLSPPSITLQ